MERLLKFNKSSFRKHLLPHAEERLLMTIECEKSARSVKIDGAKNLRVAVFGD